LSQVGPIIEVGAGAGYWASLLAARGVDIIATDATPVSLSADPFGRTAVHFPVGIAAAADAAASDSNRTMLLVWPPHSLSMAADALDAYEGRHVAVVGEHGEATADERFFDILHADFELLRWVPVPQWGGVRDDLTIWYRR